MKTLATQLRRLIREERGLEVVEYAVIVGLIVLAAITAIALLGAWASFQFETVSDTVSSKGAYYVSLV